MLQDADQTLKNLLLAEFKAAASPLIQGEDQIVFGLGPSEAPAKPVLSLYLHDLHENLDTRDQSFEVIRDPNGREGTRSRKPTRINLSYLVTAHAKDPQTEHQLLGDALGILMRNGRVPKKHLVGTLEPYGELAMALSVAQRDHWAHANAPSVWQAAGLPLRPFIGLVASALFDPYETKAVKLVRDAILGLGLGADPYKKDRQMNVRAVRLGAAGVVSGPNGEALPSVNVEVKGRSETAVTDENGVFLIRNLPPGPHTLVFNKARYVSQEEEAIAPAPGLANEFQPLTIAMREATDAESAKSSLVDGGAPLRYTLIGTLRNADGSPASFVPVKVGDRTAVTDANGEYRLYDLPHRAKELIAEVPGLGETRVAVKETATTTQLPKR